MRYGITEIHPSVWERIYNMPDGFDLGVRSADEAAQEVAEFGMRKREIQVAIFAKSFKVVAPAIVILAVVMISLEFIPGLIALGFVLGFGGILMILESLAKFEGESYQAPSYSASALEAVVDHIKPDAVVKTYVKSLIAVGESAALADYDRRDAISELKRLMDEYVRIGVVRKNLLKGNPSALSLEEEIEQISSQLAQATDPATVDSLNQSLSIANRRKERKQISASLLGRIDAELMLLRQLLGQLSDSVVAENRDTVDFTEIRERLAAITARTDETERARAELDA